MFLRLSLKIDPIDFHYNICDVPQEKGASRKIPKLFWDTCGKVAGKLRESCGKVAGKLRESCGKFDGSLREKVVGSCGKFRDSGNERKSEFDCFG